MIHKLLQKHQLTVKQDPIILFKNQVSDIVHQGFHKRTIPASGCNKSRLYASYPQTPVIMDDLCIRTDSLSFQYGPQLILDQVSLEVPKGSVYGFLGPNGAGKTTTIKLLLNLLRSQEKNIYLFGEELNAARVRILARIGSLIEQPAIYAHLSGKENLLNRAILLGVPKAKVDEVLTIVGLTAHATKKAGKYSLGMKQRLGIGLALLGDPELLILEEPTNGLDPNGIIEVRQLLQDLTKNHQKTVFVSSHLLAEVEKMATHVGIIHHGKLLFQGSVENLGELNASYVHIDIDQPVAAGEFLLHQGYAPTVFERHLQLPYRSIDEMGHINQLLNANGFLVFSLWRHKKDLENLFLEITKN